ncbi:MAG: dihydrodipicolinate synthase family protein [Verrucomicrobiae bacterium]|nr:dihydrodipicolinate synthase family protein [Verrucomicrobiae bacterium]
MSNLSPIHGLIPPIITPLADRDSLDVDGLSRLLDHLVAGSVHGIFVLGTTGEGPSLSHHLRREMVATTARLLAGRLPLYVGITDTSLVDAINLANFSADAGAAAVVAAPPFYFQAGQTELRHWFEQLLADLPLPLLLYNIPSCTKIAIELETIADLIDHESIIGLKDSSGDLTYLRSAIDLAGDRRPGWPVLVGPEHLLADAIALGASGGVAGGANLVPGLFVALYESLRSGNTTESERLQQLVIHLQELYTIGKYGSAFLKSVKCGLELRGVCSGLLAAPFDAFHAPERERVANFLNDSPLAGFLPH